MRERALVVGLGKSGLAAVEALRERGDDVIATDEKPRDLLGREITTVESLGATFVAPDALGTVLEDRSLAVVSPGVPPWSSAYRRVLAARIPIVSEIELAYRMCEGRILAVTGTKGKSTTSSLIAHLMQTCGKDVRVGGNIGVPLVEQIATAGPQTWCVAEVSSFQLEAVDRFRPRVAVLLNLQPDHLDRYSSMDEYAAAKFQIVRNQGSGDAVVLDLDDPRLAELAGALAGRSGDTPTVLGYARYRRGSPPRASLYMEGTRVVLDRGTPAPLFDRNEFALPGEHNARNLMAALLAAIAAGCDPDSLLHGVRTFAGLPHRLDQVAVVGGVRYVDDSKATNPQATIAALQSFAEPIVLIAGGRAKGTDLLELGEAIRARAKALVALGESAQELIRAAGAGEAAASMEDAVSRARRRASPGDVVLLSPAGSSFDMFGSAEERGERFARAVRALSVPEETVRAQ